MEPTSASSTQPIHVDRPEGYRDQPAAGALRGDDDAGVVRAPRVVLLHGFTQSSASWRPIANLLGPDLDVAMPDLAGHGASKPAAASLAETVGELGDACGAGTYVGYSLGGRTSLHLALERPELIERLMLVSTTAGLEDLDARAERATRDEALADRLEEGGPAGIGPFLEEWLAGPLFAHLDEAQADRRSRLVNTPDGLASSLRHHGVGAQLPLWERLRDLTMPVLVLAGENDPAYAEIGERLAAAIGGNALMLLVPDSGHAVPFEQPETFARLVRAFVSGEVGPGSGEHASASGVGEGESGGGPEGGAGAEAE